MFLGNNTLNTIEVLISKTLIEWYISHDKIFSVNNVLRKSSKIKEKMKNLYNIRKKHFASWFSNMLYLCNILYKKQWKPLVSKKKSSVSKTKLKRFILLSNWAVFGKTINFC